MPIIWRYLIREFLTIFVVVLVGFIALLVVMRLDEIAHFASLGAPLNLLLLFTLYQSFYVLPIGLTLSIFFAAYIFSHKLSKSFELTSMRSTGLSLLNIYKPIFFISLALTIINLIIVSEVATFAHQQTNLLKSQLKSISPFALLSNKRLMRSKGFFFTTLGSAKNRENATDLILAFPNKFQQKINLVLAKDVTKINSHLVSTDLTLISSPENIDPSVFDNLLIENIKQAKNPLEEIVLSLQHKLQAINNDHLKFGHLLIKKKELKNSLEKALSHQKDKKTITSLQKQLDQTRVEIIKRFSTAFGLISFAFLGFALGISISRDKKARNILLATILIAGYLCLFFTAKNRESHFYLATILYTMPQITVLIFAYRTIKKISLGIE